MARGLGDRSAALLDAFVAAWARGETPDPREALDAAPPEEREALAAAFDRVLSAAPARPASPVNRAYVASLRERLEPAEPPLLEARVAGGLRRAEVVRGLVERLGLVGEGVEEKVALRYHQLETGQLDPAGVDESVWSALVAILGRAREVLAAPWRGGPAPAPAYYRASDADVLAAAPASPGEARAADAVDRLFGVG
jgi:hypothetical protein